MQKSNYRYFQKPERLSCRQNGRAANQLVCFAGAVRVGRFERTGILSVGTPDLSAADNKIVSATDFKHASFNLMNFDGKWLQLVGKPSVPFKMMLWGTGGSGKSTLAIEFARYLAGRLNKRVLYVANEEGAGATLHEKMTRLNAFHPNLFITRTLPPRLMEYDFVFCDSANSMKWTCRDSSKPQNAIRICREC